MTTGEEWKMGKNFQTIHNRLGNGKIKTVRKWSDIQKENKVKIYSNKTVAYSISPLAFIDTNFALIGLGILAVASLENFLGNKGNVFLAEKIGSLAGIVLPIGAIYFVFKFLTTNALMWWL